MQIHVLYMPIMDQMSIPMPMVSYVTGGQRTVIQNIETSETWRARVRIVRWGSNVLYFTLTQSLSARLIFLERNEFAFQLQMNIHLWSLAVFTKKFAEFAGLKAEPEKRGLGSCVELKLCRLEKGKDGSKAFVLLSNNSGWKPSRSWSFQGPVSFCSTHGIWQIPYTKALSV